MSKIIFLNGFGFSDKTSDRKSYPTCKSADLWLYFGIDTFIDMMVCQRQGPYLKFYAWKKRALSYNICRIKAVIRRLFSVMPKSAQSASITKKQTCYPGVNKDNKQLRQDVALF